MEKKILKTVYSKESIIDMPDLPDTTAYLNLFPHNTPKKLLDRNGMQIKISENLYWIIGDKRIEGKLETRAKNFIFRPLDRQMLDYNYDEDYIYEIKNCNFIQKLIGFIYRLKNKRKLRSYINEADMAIYVGNECSPTNKWENLRKNINNLNAEIKDKCAINRKILK